MEGLRHLRGYWFHDQKVDKSEQQRQSQGHQLDLLPHRRGHYWLEYGQYSDVESQGHCRQPEVSGEHMRLQVTELVPRKVPAQRRRTWYMAFNCCLRSHTWRSLPATVETNSNNKARVPDNFHQFLRKTSGQDNATLCHAPMSSTCKGFTARDSPHKSYPSYPLGKFVSENLAFINLQRTLWWKFWKRGWFRKRIIHGMPLTFPRRCVKFCSFVSWRKLKKLTQFLVHELWYLPNFILCFWGRKLQLWFREVFNYLRKSTVCVVVISFFLLWVQYVNRGSKSGK